MSEPDLVTVIIPAFNAARTIDETLRSVRSQTHRRLEILVVDDGSVDATAQIVRSHATEDRRIRLIQQPNSGVAAARNRAIAEATSDYVAPIDADDLWRPDKIEKQLARLHRDGETVALVYAWSAVIDENSRIVAAVPGPTHTGNVVGKLFGGNFPGNGSTVLMRKAAVIEAGGYDPSLRARSAQGVEDWQLYFRMATSHEFSVVPEYLTGYRKTATGMSADLLQMLRSRDLLAEEMCNRYPDYMAEIKDARLYFLSYLYHHALSARQIMGALMIATLFIRQNPLVGAKKAFFIPVRAIARRACWRLMRWIERSPDRQTQPEARPFLVEVPVNPN
jgi:glycosyltransferase involved in cell wall biosynthesis